MQKMLNSIGVETRGSGKQPKLVSAALLAGGLLLGVGGFLKASDLETMSQLLQPQAFGELLAAIGASLLPWANGFLRRSG